MTVIMHSSLGRSLAFILANKLQSSTLLGTQLTRLFVEAYEVSAVPCAHPAASVLAAGLLRRPLCCCSHWLLVQRFETMTRTAENSGSAACIRAFSGRFSCQ